MNLELSNDKSLLYVPTKEIDFQNPPFDVREFCKSLVQLMYDKKGFGLAANQVGHSYRIFCMSGSPENFFFINPRIVNMSEEKTLELEGCLSYPGLAIKSERSNEVRIRFIALDDQIHTRIFKGLSARVIQHEMDHLNGIPFWNNISKIKFDIFKKKAYKRGWDYKNLLYKGEI